MDTAVNKPSNKPRSRRRVKINKKSGQKNVDGNSNTDQQCPPATCETVRFGRKMFGRAYVM